MKFKSLQKAKLTWGSEKQIHAMKCNPIKLLIWGKSINLASFKILRKIGCYSRQSGLLVPQAGLPAIGIELLG
jgi:hypothetical protein